MRFQIGPLDERPLNRITDDIKNMTMVVWWWLGAEISLFLVFLY